MLARSDPIIDFEDGGAITGKSGLTIKGTRHALQVDGRVLYA
jgi:hypothetical protein